MTVEQVENIAELLEYSKDLETLIESRNAEIAEKNMRENERKERMDNLLHEMKKINRINLNENIKVKLTVAGIKAYIDYMNEPNKAAKNGQPIKTKYLLPSIDDEGYTRFQLWNFMSIFGYNMTCGSDPVISPLEIIKCEPEKWTPEGQKKMDGGN